MLNRNQTKSTMPVVLSDELKEFTTKYLIETSPQKLKDKFLWMVHQAVGNDKLNADAANKRSDYLFVYDQWCEAIAICELMLEAWGKELFCSKKLKNATIQFDESCSEIATHLTAVFDDEETVINLKKDWAEILHLQLTYNYMLDKSERPDVPVDNIDDSFETYKSLLNMIDGLEKIVMTTGSYSNFSKLYYTNLKSE